MKKNIRFGFISGMLFLSLVSVYFFREPLSRHPLQKLFSIPALDPLYFLKQTELQRQVKKSKGEIRLQGFTNGYLPKRELSSSESKQRDLHFSEPSKHSQDDSKLQPVTKEELMALKQCYATQTCNFPQTDPRSYEFALGRAIALGLKNYFEQNKNNLQSLEDLTALAQDFIQSRDGFVQDQALDILAYLPPSAENLESLTQALKDSSDGDLIEKSLAECKRYLNSENGEKVDQFVQHIVESGGHFSSQRIASQIIPFINEKNFQKYQQILARLPKESVAARNLKASMEEYLLLKRGS
ncbi:MAG: hypothetical protein K1X29_03410 [Bdellovibrionales bacterium]|nr:hypothetical protein [Bdellovibrionales bacterium]